MTIITNVGPIKPPDDHSIAGLAEYYELAAFYDGLSAQAERSGRYHASLAYAQTAAKTSQPLRRIRGHKGIKLRGQ